MRFSLRRQPRGRHALGAAVTAIPSAPAKPAPVPVPVPVPAQAWPPANAVVSAPQPPRPAVVPSPAVPAVPGTPAPAEPLVAAPSLPLLPVQAVDLDPALLDLAGPLAPPVSSGPRVELGFADGSFRTLDPDSSAAQQLSELVELLTHRD
jgi:hypothetical protein